MNLRASHPCLDFHSCSAPLRGTASREPPKAERGGFSPPSQEGGLKPALPAAATATDKTEPSASAKGNPSSKARLANIEHWIVIYQENWSFDGLYGKFPGADGLNRAAATIAQVDRNGRPLATLPDPSTDPSIPPGLPVRPYDLSQYVTVTGKTKDLVHTFYTEQLQIDNGYVRAQPWLDGRVRRLEQ